MPDEHNLIGTRLGYYTLNRVIGKGGMGMVFVGKHEELQVDYAVKVLSRWTDDVFVARFRREAQRAAALDHPNIIRVFHFGHDPNADVVYLVMNLVQGPSLRELLRQTAAAGQMLPVQKACGFALQVLFGLEYAHGNDIIHRDIKPDNILLEGGQQVKIVDFGLARMRDDEASITTGQQALGTPEYMALEQWEGRDVDARVDLHATGIVLYEMLTGQKPFSGTPTSIFTARLSDTYEKPAALRGDLPDGLEAVVLKMMARHPDDRFATAADAIEALTPFAPPEISGGSTRRVLPAAAPSGTQRTGRIAPVELPSLPERPADPLASDAALSIGRIAAPDGAAVTPSDRADAAHVATTVQPPGAHTIDHHTIILPPIQSFTCQHSGECCSYAEVPLGRDEQQRIGAREWGPRLPHLVTQSPFTEGTRHPGRPTFNLEPADGHCPFHDSNQMLCAIHEQLGARAKPLACQQFPYRFTVTPRGTLVGLSFSCPTVRRNTGKPVSAQGPAIARFVQRSQINVAVHSGMETVQLGGGRTASWEQILNAGTVLDSILADTSLPVWRGLIAGERLLAQLQVAASGLDEGKPPVPAEQIVERVRNEEFVPDRLSFGDMRFWARLTVRLQTRADMYYAMHSAFSRLIHGFRSWRRWMRLLNGNLWGLRWTLQGDSADTGAGRTSDRKPASTGNHDTPRRGVEFRDEVTAAEALAVPAKLPSDADDMLRRFLRIQLHGNEFFGPPINRLTFVSGYRMLLVAVSMVMFIARSRAAARSVTALTFDDIDHGMSIVADCYYSTAWFPRRMTPVIESALTKRAGLARKLLLKWCG